MKTKSTVGRLITHLSEWRESGARVAAMLLLLCTTAIPAWASWWTWDRTINDEGGGEVRYRGETTDHVVNNWSLSYYFKTEKTFNPVNNQFYWEFNLYADYSWQFGVNTGACEFIGEIYVMTADSQVHKIAHWEKSYTSFKDISYSITDSTWGYIYVSQMPQNDITIQYMPTSRAFEDGVKCIMMKESASEA
ncbi:MAG: hypothetical protein IKN59_09455, partial [Paludibacteraceae bacterium]|nr:hypothetical protein [Paludibacteraceae bacterium]